MNGWQRAKIIETVQSASDMKSIFVIPEKFLEFMPGQHFELCMPGENVIRKYSVAPSMNEKDHLEFGVELISNGALSPKLWALKVGDEVEMRGPIGQSFVWDRANASPIILLGAGSGIVPLLSIYYSYKEKYPDGECIFIMTAKDSAHVMNYEQIKDFIITRFTATQGRIDLEFLKNKIGGLINRNPMCYICGGDNFVDDMVDNVLELGIKEENIKSERFI